MVEIWKDIEGFESKYFISNHGNIKSAYTGSNMSPIKHPNGQYRVKLSNKGYDIHQLVAKHFLKNPKNAKFLEHIDGNKKNNHVDNLRWKNRKTLPKAKPVKKTYENIKGEIWVSVKEFNKYDISNMLVV